jgi:hypothetical protein
MKRPAVAALVYRARIDGIDRHTAEAFYLELRRLARMAGLRVTKFRIEKQSRKASA